MEILEKVIMVLMSGVFFLSPAVGQNYTNRLGVPTTLEATRLVLNNLNISQTARLVLICKENYPGNRTFSSYYPFLQQIAIPTGKGKYMSTGCTAPRWGTSTVTPVSPARRGPSRPSLVLTSPPVRPGPAPSPAAQTSAPAPASWSPRL